MNGYKKHILFKLSSVAVVEAVLLTIMHVVSVFIVQINVETLPSILCGAFVAVMVVHVYDLFLLKKTSRIKGEIQTLTDVALKKYEPQDKHY